MTTVLYRGRVGIERGVGLRARLRGGARVDDRVTRAESVAVAHQAVVGGERELPVVGVPEELRAVEQVAVDLLGVDPELAAAAGQQVLGDEAVGAVGPQDDVLRVAVVRVVATGVPTRLRAGEARVRVALAGVEDHVLGPGARALDLEVAAHARAQLTRRDPLAVVERGVRRIALDPAALDVDQVLVVGTGRLVLVARCRGRHSPAS